MRHFPDTIPDLFATALILTLCCAYSLAQTTYTMQNAIVDDCEGTLTDSDMGPEDGQYDHNENYVFTICVDGADEIVFTFDFFATEDNYDVLAIYDGPDTNSTLIGQYSGLVQPPPVVVANSGCLTFHFTSDDNILASGWSGSWNVQVEEPDPPALSINGPVDCPLASALFSFDMPVDCDLFQPAHFNIIGPGNPSIAQVVVLDCDSSTHLGQNFQVIFNDPLSQEGTYRLLFDGQIQDACGEWHDVSDNLSFTLSNCPIDVVIELVERSCAGNCGSIRANVSGSSSNNFNYQWSHTNLDQQEVPVCTSDSLWIFLTVTDNSSGSTASDSIMYAPLENPVLNNPLSGDTICSSSSDHIYDPSIPGGRFYSSVIPNWERTSGRYQFWRWSWDVGLSKDTILYRAPNGCVVRDSVIISPVWAGSIEAACLNSGSFQLTGTNPSGGSWSGPHVSPSGLFDPVEAGSFVLAYEAPSGCTDWKRLNVADSILMPDVDTICGYNEFRFEAEPFGGRWTGPGIINEVQGRCQAWRITPDSTYTYTYTLNGCSKSIEVYVYDLTVGPDRSMCDRDSLLYLGVRGSWTGPGIYIDSLNAFDISMLGPGEYYYEMDDGVCTDEFYLNIVSVEVTEEQSLYFCKLDAWIALDEYLDFQPDNGSFSGAGIIDTLGGWYFNPDEIGSGVHAFTYEALGCSYEISLEVEAEAEIPEYEFCERSSAIQLTAQPSGGIWSGPGVLDGNSGLFDPQSLDTGMYEILYTAPSGCETRDTIEIFRFEQVEISGVDQQYCHLDSIINFTVQPQGGSLMINGQMTGSSFNPAVLGTGNHELFYTRGNAQCASSQRLFFSVLPPISGAISATRDSICAGTNTVVSIDVSGGVGTLNPVWNEGLGFGNSHIINPDSSTTYIVNVSDGCSDNFRDTIEIYVYPPFDIEYQTGPPVCFEDTTHIEITPPPNGAYEAVWNVDPPDTGFIYVGRPGRYTVTITERNSTCTQSYDLDLPGSPPLRANFSTIPNQECIDIIENELEIIDLSNGASGGWIDFGDGSEPYDMDGGVIKHSYQDSGLFEILQVIENDLGCRDSMRLEICVRHKVLIFIPNIFTPNQDGRNDLFSIHGSGIANVRWQIYDRYGTLIYEGRSLEDQWDGTYNGKPLMPGVFVCRIEYQNAATGTTGTEWQSVTLDK